MTADTQTSRRTRIIGLGNPILGDDGVGWQVVEAVRSRLGDETVDVLCLSVGGVSLMEQLVGCDRALLVDAVVTGGTPGEVWSAPLDALDDPSCGHTASTHDTTLATALSLGRALQAPLPEDIWLVGVEVDPRRLHEFSEALSPEVSAAVSEAVRRVEEWLASTSSVRPAVDARPDLRSAAAYEGRFIGRAVPAE